MTSYNICLDPDPINPGLDVLSFCGTGMEENYRQTV